MHNRQYHRRPGFRKGPQEPRKDAAAPGPESSSNAPRGDLIFGRRPVFEAFDAGKRPIHKLWVVRGTGGGIVERTIQLARDRGVPIEWTQWEWLDRTTEGHHHQGIAAQASATEFLELDDFVEKLGPTADALLVALDEIQDPQNMGAILRSAAFFNVQGAIVPRWRSGPVSDATMRVSSGAVEYVPLIRVRNLSDALVQLKEANFEIIGADMAGAPLETIKPAGRCVLVMGSEGSGLRRLVSERCDKLVGIKRRGKLDSLNVGAATAIFLYEFFRGR
jgi:23S rRNA (guanosine2251-2'-O)-methyltransferase